MAEAQKKALSGAEFMQLLASETEMYEVPGFGVVELRNLTHVEVSKILAENKGNEADQSFAALKFGMLAPQLSAAEFDQLRALKPGPLFKIARRIMEISGMTEGSGPLAGTGS